MDQARAAFRSFRDHAAQAPDEITAGIHFITAADGSPVAGLSACHIAPLDEAEKTLAPLVNFGTPLEAGIEDICYLNIQARGEVGEDRVRAALGGNHDRLIALKNRYDLTNFFQLNANIKPSV